MGFTLVLDAQLSEYYCSSTNGPGFKVGIYGNYYYYYYNVLTTYPNFLKFSYYS